MQLYEVAILLLLVAHFRFENGLDFKTLNFFI